MEPDITAAAPPRRRALFLWLTGAVALIALALPRAWEWAELDPSPLMRMKFLGQFVALVCLTLLVVWFFLFSRFSWVVRLGVLAVILLIAGLGMAAIRTLEFTGSWQPIPRFRWEKDHDANLEQHRAHMSIKDLPPLDLTIDSVRDFPRFRGLRGDGIVTGLTLATNGNDAGLVERWRAPCGGGYAGFVVAGNAVITIEQRRGNEVVVCYDRATRMERWTYAYPALFERSEPMGGDGPRATPAIADGAVYSLGATGHLACLDGQTGLARWTVNILEDNQAKNAEWGMSGSPLIVGDLVVVNPGIDPLRNARQSLAAYNRHTGKRVWAEGNRPAGYSAPRLATLAGVEQILLFDAAGLAGFDPQNGKELWSFPWETMMGMNIIQPLVIGDDQVLISSELSNGAALLRVKKAGAGFAVEEVWRNKQFASKFSSPVFAKGHIYGLSYGILTCLDAATGKRLWKDGRYGHGQILLIGEHILVLTEMGDVALVAADPAGFRELARIPVLYGKTWNTPAVAGNQLFVRNHREMACYDLPEQTPRP